MTSLYNNAILAIINLLTFLTCSWVDAVGLVPIGSHTSEAYGMDTVELAIDDCNEHVFCAGITYRPAEENETQPTIHFHAFVPPLLNETEDTGWTTYRSNKTFVYHPGKLESKDILPIDIDPSSLSLSKAKDICDEHPDCVAFTYPVQSLSLSGFDNVTFASTIDDFSHTEGDYWRTFMTTDVTKASKINTRSIVYDDDLEYGSCCDRAVLDTKTNTIVLPSIQDIEEVDTLPRIPCTISNEEFRAKYEMTRTPVMLVGCDKDWPAKERWTFDGLMYRFDNDTRWRSKRYYTNGDYLENVPWKKISEDMAAGRFFYVFDKLDHPAGKTLEAEYATPSPVQGSNLFSEDFPPDDSALRWFCLGAKDSGTMPHKDPYESDAWNSLLVGHKWWTLYPADAEEKSMECDYKCSSAFPSMPDWYASVGRNILRTEYASGKTPIHVLQKPGETIYVPYEIIHSVLNMDESIAITANWGSVGNLQKVWETVVREGTEEQWQKMYYETFTDEQRAAVRDGEIWPPEEFAGISIDSDDDEYGEGEEYYDYDEDGDDDDDDEEDEANEEL